MFQLPPLPYAFDALSPAIDEQGVRRHYLDNHAKYIEKVNALVAAQPKLRGQTLLDLALTAPRNSPLANNAAQAWAHDFWWNSMVPVGARQRLPAFLDVSVMRDAWITEGKALFGSGWVWLSLTRDGKLVVEALPNAELPQRKGHTPILVMDLWEHAYYCQYGTNREEFLKNTFHLLNWRIAEQRLAAAGGI